MFKGDNLQCIFFLELYPFINLHILSSMKQPLAEHCFIFFVACGTCGAHVVIFQQCFLPILGHILSFEKQLNFGRPLNSFNMYKSKIFVWLVVFCNYDLNEKVLSSTRHYVCETVELCIIVKKLTNRFLVIDQYLIKYKFPWCQKQITLRL